MKSLPLFISDPHPNRKIDRIKTYKQTSDFLAHARASADLRKANYSIGSMCWDEPIGFKKGFDYIAKWKNLTYQERAQVDGVLLSNDFRHGPVYAVYYAE
jgi:hypothetical protein